MLFYLWVAFYAFYFLATREAIGLAAFATLNFALVLVCFRAGLVPTPEMGSNEDVSAFVLLTGTVAVAGAFIVLLRSRVTRLIGQLSDAASIDPMTGLFNRRGFQDAVERELSRAERSNQPVSVLQADCDLFKSYNIRLGNEAGDSALRRIGRMLEDDRRRVDVAARIGGEEFGVILPDTDQHEAFLVAERLRMRIAEMFADQPIPLTVSFGVVTYPVHARDSEGMQVAAENALYAAKVLGRDRSVLHSEEVAEILSAGGAGLDQRDEAQLATVLNLAEALDMRDEGTARHSQTVGRYCEMMARELGFSRDHADRVRVAGVLHDIGKIGVADSILQKPGPLTDAEYDGHEEAPRDRRPDPGRIGPGRHPPVGAGPPRAPGRPRLPRRQVRRRGAAGGADPGRGRRLRGHDQRSRLPQGHRPRCRPRRAVQVGGQAVRRRRGRGVPARPGRGPPRAAQRTCSVGRIRSSLIATRRGRVTM